MTALNESSAIAFKRLDLFPALGRLYVVKIFSLTSMKYCNIYCYTYCMWLHNMFHFYVYLHTHIHAYLQWALQGNFLVTLTSLIKKKKKGKQIGQAAQMNIKFITAEDNIFLVIHTLTFLQEFSLPSDTVT